ncbi:MAG: VOC family protein [Mongoliibacter sp.]|uniref:VOC family protein n=1 Tax=Mongoliibacter sp. TaxID=2022438 RepID=UPI0012F2BB91|nr:VOC family protein [Mongoliibacter sp.]TVP52811.1 MAG: VOC family protein [Mongoliibacter sp.]
MVRRSNNSKSLPIISGIQQVGIGVSNAKEAWKWYRKYFGMDIPVFEDAATASLMTRYTNNIAEQRYAILAMNMQGGGGFEVWQYTSKDPLAPKQKVELGDLGINAIKIRARDIVKTFQYFKEEGLNVLGKIVKSPDGKSHFFIKDPYNNLFQVEESDSWFNLGKSLTGGVSGCIIGVSDIEKSLPLYQNLLGYTELIYKNSGIQNDLAGLGNEEIEYKRIKIQSSPDRCGAFSELLCQTEIELISCQDRKPNKIFQDRFWGDLGFIHLCFDIRGMAELEMKASSLGFSFTVNSANSFDMGKAAGQFAYCEDPDGTLIEFVETHKVPIAAKFGFFLNLRNRKPEKHLPKWMLKLLSFNRVKD